MNSRRATQDGSEESDLPRIEEVVLENKRYLREAYDEVAEELGVEDYIETARKLREQE